MAKPHTTSCMGQNVITVSQYLSKHLEWRHRETNLLKADGWCFLSGAYTLLGGQTPERCGFLFRGEDYTCWKRSENLQYVTLLTVNCKWGAVSHCAPFYNSGDSLLLGSVTNKCTHKDGNNWQFWAILHLTFLKTAALVSKLKKKMIQFVFWGKCYGNFYVYP